MKRRIKTMAGGLTAAGAWILALGLAQAAQLAAMNGSALWLEGDSTLHPFSSTSTAVGVRAIVAGGTGDLKEAIASGRIGELKVTVPVASLKSGKGGLDKNLYKAMKEDRFPAVTFELHSYRAGKEVDGAIEIQAAGTLAVAGSTRAVALAGRAIPGKSGLRLIGRHELLMTDFGIQPPKMMGGMIKTRDQIVVHYDLKLGLENAQTERRMQ